MFYRENIRFLKKITGRYFLSTLALVVFSGAVYSQITYTFIYTAGQQTITLQAGSYSMQCWGANGGTGSYYSAMNPNNNIDGGKGGYSAGAFTLNTTTTLFVHVGGIGTNTSLGSNPGGYNGGGNSSSASYQAGSGGGASHVATVPGTLSALSGTQAAVKMVAGGGGGGGNQSLGGHGGGLTGVTSPTNTQFQNRVPGGGGTQTAGGACYPGGSGAGFGQGGTTAINLTAGGGGGWYGGCTGNNSTGGGGGSGYIGGVSNGTTIVFGQSGFVPNPDITGNGYVIITNLCSVTLNSIANPICIGKTTTLSTNALSNYSWSTGTTIQSIVVSPTITTTYSVSATNTILTTLGTATCTGNSMLTVTVNTLPMVNIATLSNTICPGHTVMLVSSGNATTYTIQPGSITNPTAVVSPTVNTIYTVSATDANGCVNTANVTQSVVVATTIALSPSSPIICSGSTVSITGTGAATYTWQPSGFVGNTFTSSLSSPAFYTVTGTSSLGCIGSAGASVAILPVPALSFITASITCASLGTATVFPTGGIGPFSYTWMPTAQTFSIANNLNPNTYTLTTNDLGTGCITTGTTQFTSLIPLTGNLFNTPSITCNGASTGTAIVTNLAGGSPTQNYFWNNGTSTFTNQFVNILPAGNWNVNVTDALTGCQINSVFAISQPPAMTLNLSSSSPTACVTDSIILTSTLSGGTPGYSFNWTSGPISTSYIVNQAIGGTYIYTLNAFDSYTCPVSTTISVDFINNPVLNIVPPSGVVSICPLQTGTITVTGATNYTWSNNTFNNTLIDSPVNSQAYVVTGEALGCTSSVTAYILLKPVPNPIIISNSPVCENQPINLDITNAASYIWNGPLSFSASIKNPIINTAALNNGGIYNVTVTAINNCTASTSGVVNVNPIPTISITPNTTSICAGIQTVALNAVGSATLFNWFPSQGLSGTSGGSVSVSVGAAQTLTYSLVGSLSSCTNVATAIVNVVPPPTPTAMLSSPSLCAQAFNGSPNTITVSTSGANSYTLYTPNHLVSSNPNGTTTPITTGPPYIPTGIATATLAGSNGVCVVTRTLIFAVIPNPTLGVNSLTPVICAGETFTYTAFGAQSYSWSSATPGSTLYTSGNIAIADPTINSVFSVMGSSLGCFSPYKTTTITVNELPDVIVTPNSPSICAGSPVSMQASGAVTYTWVGSNGYAKVSADAIFNAPQSAGKMTFTVTGTAANTCSALTTATLTTWDLPVASIKFLPSEKVCLYKPLTMQASGGVSYDWTLPNQFNYSGQTVSVTVSDLSYAGIYTVITTDANNCRGQATKQVIVFDLPYGSLSGKKESCVPFCSEFEFLPALKTNSLISASWEIGYGGLSLSKPAIDNGRSFSNCFTSPGQYLITGKLLDTETFCANTQTYIVTAFEKPKADFTWLPEKPTEGIEDVIFTNTTKGEQQKKWNWFFGNNEIYSTNENTSYFFREMGDYPIAMVVQNKWECIDTVVKYVKIESGFNVFVPNVFTPNGDGLNDIFLPIVSGVKQYRLEVFNRWGERVFLSLDPQQGWDGIFKEEESKQDVYVWKIVVSTISGEAKEMQGSAQLHR